MLMLRRGRPVQIAGSIVDVDLTLKAPQSLRPRNSQEPWRPPIEVYELVDELVVRMEIAGLSDRGLDVTSDRGELTIRGERLPAPCADRRRFHESRIRYGPFLAAVHLPFPVDERAATADYQDGLLTVRLPRLAASRIAISGLDGGMAAR
jgi:HSP20 family protein